MKKIKDLELEIGKIYGQKAIGAQVMSRGKLVEFGGKIMHIS